MNSILNDRYKIIQKIGQGGMGSVWLAKDTLLDDREIAIKTLPSYILKDKNSINRIKKEAQISLQLSHPNLSAVRAFEIDGDLPYIVMDYVQGETLSQYLKKNGRITDFKAFEIFEKLVLAVEYAHAKGIIHRDIKPSNIMLNLHSQPILLDFGISDETRTVSGFDAEISGTFPYMSPEQLKGDTPHVSHDIYSLAATAYECIIGHPPFYTGNIIEQILNLEPPKINCECWFCNRINFAISKNILLRPKRALQLADGERRRRAFIRWVFNRVEAIVDSPIGNDRMATSRLEHAAETCLNNLNKNEISEINVPYLVPNTHVNFFVTRDDLRQLHW